MSSEIHQILGYLVAFVGLPAIVISLAYVIMKRPVTWLIELVVEVLNGEMTASSPLHLSLASNSDVAAAPVRLEPPPAVEEPPADPPDPVTLARYYGEWGAIRDGFDVDPEAAVREAHAFTLELASRLGRRPALRTKLNLGDGGTGSVGELLRAAGNGAGADRTVEALLRGGEASRRELETAIRQYARVVGAMLRGE